MSKSIGTNSLVDKEIPLTDGKQLEDGITCLAISILSLSVIVKQNSGGM